MISYGMGVLPLIRELRGAHPCVTHLWYADDAGAGEEFSHILENLRDLQARGLARGYYPEPTKTFVCGPVKCSLIGGVLLGDGYPSGDGTPIPRGIYMR